jgi:putative ABC transport system permease protein
MRQTLEMFRIALASVWANKLRSFLTILGNIVAVMSIITVVSLIQGTNAAVTDAIVSQVGSDALVIERTGIVTSFEDEERIRSNPRVTLADAAAIRRHSRSADAIMAQAERSGEVRYRGEVLESVRIRGVTRDYVDFPTFTAERGRLITPTEIDRNQNVTLLGWDTADRLFGLADPLDRTIKIQGVHFRVVGVSEKVGSTFGRSQDEFAIIPLRSYYRLFGSQQSLALMVRPTVPDRLQSTIDEATVALRIARRLKPRDENNFGLFTSDTAIGIYEDATRGISTVLVGVVALSLVVGGIVIMNIMLMTVSERTREIGLRKALGARRRDVLSQILAESIILSTLGGVLGTALGSAGAAAISAATPVPATIHPWSVALAILMTALVGLFFGLYPASRAAALDPIAALGRGE